MNNLYHLRTFLNGNPFKYQFYLRRTDVILKKRVVTVPRSCNDNFNDECIRCAKMILLIEYDFNQCDISKVLKEQLLQPNTSIASETPLPVSSGAQAIPSAESHTNPTQHP